MKKVICAALAALMVLTLLPGCQNDKGGEGVTELLIGIPGADGVTVKLAENFKNANADKYKVTTDETAWGDFVQKIKLQFVAKNDVTPVFFTDSMQAMTFGAQGAVADLTEWADKELDKELYTSALTAITDTEGRLWGVPHGVNSVAVLYNKDVFDARGVAYPTEDWTWQDMLDMAKELTYDSDGDGEVDVYGIQYSYNITLGWLPFMAAVGVNPYKDDYRNSNLDDPKVKEAMEKYAQPINDGLRMPAADLAAYGGNQAFADGKIAMNLVQYSVVNGINMNYPGLNYDAVIMPIGWNGERSCIYVPNTWQVYAGLDENVKAAALDWLKYFLSEEAQMLIAAEGTGLPSMKTALDAVPAAQPVPANLDAFWKGIDEHGMTLLENPASATTRTFIDAMCNDIQNGGNIDEAIAVAHDSMQKELDYFYENR